MRREIGGAEDDALRGGAWDGGGEAGEGELVGGGD
jgi:hypothetical protein